MGKQQMYTQCRLERPLEDGTKQWDEVWIPAEFAVIGKKLSFKKGGYIRDRDEGLPFEKCIVDDAGVIWENGWIVVFKGITRSAESLREYERDHLKQRQASDI